MRRRLKDLPAQTEQRQSTSICRGIGKGSRAQSKAKAERYAEVALSAAVKLCVCMCVYVCMCVCMFGNLCRDFEAYKKKPKVK